MFSLTEGRQYFYTLLFYDEVMNFIQSFHSKIKSKQFTQDELNKVKCFIEDFTSDFAKAFDNEAKYGEPLTRDEVKGLIKNYIKDYVEDFDNKIKDDKLLTQDEIKGLIKDCLKDYVESFDNKMEDGELLTRGEIKGFIKDYVKDLVEDFNNKTKVETKQVTNKAIIIGSVCGVIAGLAVGVGCGVAGAQLSVLAIVGIAVAAALAVGIISDSIKYKARKKMAFPSSLPFTKIPIFLFKHILGLFTAL